jgi:hypothetical protein
MSRSRRKRKLGKCFCGRGKIPYHGEKRHGRQLADCPVLHYPHQENDRRGAFREQRVRAIVDVE